MSHRRTIGTALSVVIALCVAGAFALPAQAAPSTAQTSADRAAVNAAVEQYEAAQARAAEIDARLSQTSTDLDQAVADENAARDTLRSRVQSIYRTDDTDLISVLLGASTLQDFVARWDLLARIARRDAETLAALEAARVEAERSAEELLSVQAEQAQALDELAAQVASARSELAASEAALREYEARMAASPTPAPAPAPTRSDSTQQLTGSGAWQTAVASHYGRNFTGRGASGEIIGPYSMIVAHRTLPFGTLIEFEYNGRRAVAKVADRGPHIAGREFDLGPGVVRVLDFSGVHEVRYRIISQ